MSTSTPTTTSAPSPRAYRLVRTPVAPVEMPALDPAQQAVVDHRGGPLLVLAGPGTGKTTTLVEAVVDRVERGGPGGTPLDPSKILVLTFSRKAATELRTRITARLGRTTTDTLAWTFHGFCYALLRKHQPPERFADPTRLLSGPEQHAVVRDLLLGSVEVGTARWPEDLRGLLDRRGFVEEVRRLLARVRQLGLDPVDLADLARVEGRPDWAAAAAFCEEYLDVLELRGVLDYGELVRAAAALAGDPVVRAELRSTYDIVLVDEYQDTDPAQEELLHQIAGDGRELVVVGDPDQSIYAFRGADVSNILEFPERFRSSAGAPAAVRVLQSSRRAGAELLAASRSVARRMPLPTLPARSVRAHRELVPADPTPPGAPPGPGGSVAPGGQLSLLDDQAETEHPPGGPGVAPAVSVRLYPTAGSEVDAIADLLRRSHLEDGMPWSSMAVLVRSGARSIPTLRRALATAGVPVDVAGDEVPLAGEAMVRTLLLAMSCAVDVERLTAEAARDLLMSPLVRTRPAQLRRLGRALRAADRARVTELGNTPSGSGELLRTAVAEPATVLDLAEAEVWPVRALRRVLDAAEARRAADGTAEDVLWTIWSATDWPDRLARASYAGGTAGRRADADLDAVVALFDVAARAEERLGRVGVADFVEQVKAQQIPADTLAEVAVRDQSVRLLTAHRSKGLEWDLVVVAHVTEDVWPDLRRRDSLLAPNRIGRTADGAAVAVEPPGVATLLVDERRLFYVAVTRARRRLVVTSVAAAEDGGDRPSRFLQELGVEPVLAESPPTRRLALPDLVAELRAYASDGSANRAVREAAAQRLARLAVATAADGRRLVPAAHPDSWWGVRPRTDPGIPMRAEDAPISLSGSALEQLTTCPLQWFFQREARAAAGSGRAAGFGSIVHAIADAVTKGVLEPDLDALDRKVAEIWPRLEFDIPWHSERERGQAREALERFLTWHASARGRTVVDGEVSIEVEVPVAGHRVILRGRIDRVELDDDGQVWVIDFKTSKGARTKQEVADHLQLGMYQVAIRAGALNGVPGVPQGARPGGAELVYLRQPAPYSKPGPKVLEQPAVGPAGSHLAELAMERAVERIADERFPAIVGPQCQYCTFRRSCPADGLGQQVVQ